MTRPPGTRFLLPLIAALGAATAARAGAEETVVLGGTGEDLTSVSYQLDIAALLEQGKIFTGSVSGPVWTIKASEGRKLLRLPLRFAVPDEKAKAGSSAVDIAGGQFAAYRLVTGETGQADGGGRSSLAAELPPNAPHFTRDFKVTPDGMVEWKLERYVFRGKVTGDNLFAYKLERAKLRKKRPERPGGDAGRGARAKYRRKRDKYLDLLKQVQKAPERFKGPLPKRVWALFELSPYKEKLEIDGTDPLPWTVNLGLLKALRSAASGDGGEGEGGTGWVSRVTGAVMNDPHPYTLRLVAHTIARSGAAGEASMASPLYQVMRAILKSDDKTARQALIQAIVDVSPPTRASRALLKSVSSDIAPELQLMSLKGMVGDRGTKPARLRQVVQTANRMLRDKQGPPVFGVLKTLRKAAKRNLQQLAVLTQSIRFRDMPGPRRRRAIVFAIENAPGSRLCASWLNQRLLGSASESIRRETLEALRAASRGEPLLEPAVNSALDFFFAGSGLERGGRRQARLKAPIPIRSASHKIFSAIRSGDARMRRLAWQSLTLFRVGNPSSERPLASEKVKSIYDTLLSAALDQRPTPVQSVAFLERQPHRDRTTSALISIAVRGSREAAQRATRALFGSGRSLTKQLRELSPGERVTFAQKVYDTLAGETPGVVYVLYERTSKAPAATWFGKRVAAGQLPEPKQWIEAYDREARLLRLCTSSSQRLSLAAALVLVRSVGGGRDDARKLVGKIRDMDAPELKQLKKAWSSARKTILERRLREAAGKYRLALRVDNADGTQRAARVGTVTLTVDNGKARLGNKNIPLSRPDGRLGLVLEEPGALKNLPHPAIAKLPLGGVKRAIEFSRRDDGSWHAEARLSDGRTLALDLIPVGPGS